jgi:hypothetical protein
MYTSSNGSSNITSYLYSCCCGVSDSGRKPNVSDDTFHYNHPSAREAVDTTYTDKNFMVAFGRPFMSNPDLVSKVKDNIPFAPSGDRSTIYAQSDHNYIDFPSTVTANLACWVEKILLGSPDTLIPWSTCYRPHYITRFRKPIVQTRSRILRF